MVDLFFRNPCWRSASLTALFMSGSRSASSVSTAGDGSVAWTLVGGFARFKKRYDLCRLPYGRNLRTLDTEIKDVSQVLNTLGAMVFQHYG